MLAMAVTTVVQQLLQVVLLFSKALADETSFISLHTYTEHR